MLISKKHIPPAQMLIVITEVKKRIWPVTLGYLVDAIVQGLNTVHLPSAILKRPTIQLPLPIDPPFTLVALSSAREYVGIVVTKEVMVELAKHNAL